jgi:POT family proton-dependent oligopeptide transporter
MDAGLWGQPRGLALLFGVEMWERFSYYGMRALLVLYLINGLHWRDADALQLYGTYTAMAYAVQIFGGVLADRWLGTKRALLIGGTVIACGHFALAVPVPAFFYLGLILIVLGTGLFKPNVTTLVGQLYPPGDLRRDPGFTVFYIGINLGGFIAPFITGYLGERVGWRWGFSAAGFGMLCSLVMFVWGQRRYLQHVGNLPAQREVAVALGPVGGNETHRGLGLLIVFAFAALFWAGYEQAGTSLNLFAERNTQRHIVGFLVPTAWFQSVQPLAVLLTAPLFSALWLRLARRGREPRAPYKMVAGLLFLALGFGVLAIGGRLSDSGVAVSPWFLVGCYTLEVLGEMCLSPVGLSYVTRVAPIRHVSAFVALWFLAIGIGNKLAGSLAAWGAEMPRGGYFSLMFVISAVAGLGLWGSGRWITRLTGESFPTLNRSKTMYRSSRIAVVGLVVSLGILGASRAAVAQAAPNREAVVEVRREYLADLDTLKARFLALANAIPAEKFSWRPGTGVRSVGEVFMHVASEFYGWAPVAYGGLGSPVVGQGREAYQKFEAMSTKPEVLKHLKESAEYALSTVGAMDPSALTGIRKIYGGDRTIIQTSFGVLDDLHEHLGQLIAYARMNGVTPPWSK